MRITSNKLAPLTRYRRIYDVLSQYRCLSQTKKERLLVQFYELNAQIDPKHRLVNQ